MHEYLHYIDIFYHNLFEYLTKFLFIYPLFYAILRRINKQSDFLTSQFTKTQQIYSASTRRAVFLLISPSLTSSLIKIYNHVNFDCNGFFKN